MTDPVPSKDLINELRLRARHEIRLEGIDPVSVLTRAADEIERLSRRCTDVEGFIRMMGWKFDGEFYEAITPEPADHFIDVHAVCDERDRLRAELATIRLKHDGLAEAVARKVSLLPDEGFISCSKRDLHQAINEALGSSSQPPRDEPTGTDGEWVRWFKNATRSNP